MTNEPENTNGLNTEGEAGEAKPKKKKPIMIFRPQNSRTGAVKSGQRPGTAPARREGAPAAGRPVRKNPDAARTPEEGRRPVDPARRSPDGTRRPAPEGAGVRKPAGEGASRVRPAASSRRPEGAPVHRPETEEAAAVRKTPAPELQPEQTTAAAAVVQPDTAAVQTPAAAPAAENAPEVKAAPEPETKKEEVSAPAAETVTETTQQKAPAAEAVPESAPAPEKPAEEVKSAGAFTGKTLSSMMAEPVKNLVRKVAPPPMPVEEPAKKEPEAGGRRTARTDQSWGASHEGSSRSGGRRDQGGRDGRSEGGRPARDTRDSRDSRDSKESRDGYSRQGQAARGDRTERRDGGRTAQSGSRTFPGRDQAPASRRAFGGKASGDAKSFEKEGREGRSKNERSKGDRRGDRQDRQDKFDRMEQSRSQSGRSGAKTSKAGKFIKPVPKPEPEEVIKSITLPDTITLKDLADMLKIQAAAIVKKLFLQGKIVTVNEEIDFDTAEEIAMDYDVICEHEEKVDVLEELLKDEDDDPEAMVSRPPVVCVMGHVDHGKTSLLDAIRNTHVIDREAGGITQHIGASVVTCNGQKITFLDTPGHEAFTAMRMRGANSTDIAILVIAADDGVMPQTVEAINHAKAAGIEIIVAINKIDKPGANIERVKQELTEYELLPEDWGGSTIFVPVSAKTHEGIDTLLEMVLLTAEVMELKSNPNRRARGLIIEAQLDKGRGPVATVLVQKGTLRVGDPIAAGSCYGKVRAMTDDKGRPVKEAGPSTPVEVLGFNDVPGAGEILVSPDNEKEARSFAETFISEGRERMIEETRQKMSLDDLFSQIQAGNLKELNLIVKADVQGSVEAVKQSLLKLSNEEVVVKIIHSGAGNINESDVTLASASNAIIIGFNVRPDPAAKSTAEQEGVDIRLYRVIYDAINDVESAMKGMLDPVFEEKIIGHAEIRQIFKASGVGTIAGSYVLDGVFQRGCSARITRDGKQIFDGAIASLKRFKDDVKEVRAGYECGLVFEKFNDIAELDLVEAYIMVEVPR